MTRNEFIQIAAVGVYTSPGKTENASWKEAERLANAAPQYIKDEWEQMQKNREVP